MCARLPNSHEPRRAPLKAASIGFAAAPRVNALTIISGRNKIIDEIF